MRNKKKASQQIHATFEKLRLQRVIQGRDFEVWSARLQQDRGRRQAGLKTNVQTKGMEKVFPMAGKEEKEEELVRTFLEVLHLRPSNTRVGAEEEDAAEGGGDQGGRQGGVADQDH